jgi:hypothetical protein
MEMVSRQSTLAALLGSLAVTGASAGGAFAGEVTGNGTPTAGPTHANSICVFSGKNDDPNSPVDGGPAQSYGRELNLGLQDPHVFNPGDACRGGSNFARQ